LTWVERNFGYAVARVYAGHTDGGSETGATAIYVRASLSEVAAALAALTGEPHPLATAEGWWCSMLRPRWVDSDMSTAYRSLNGSGELAACDRFQTVI
jgi:hypothetical protein